MNRLMLACLLLAGCSSAPPGTDLSVTATPAATATLAGTPAQTPTPQEVAGTPETPPVVEDTGPPLPILHFRPEGDPREGFEKSRKLPGYAEVKALGPNPVPWSQEAVMEGQMLYREHCASCHCWDGDGDGERSVGMKPAPRNFFKVHEYKYGTGEMALFRTSRYGIPDSPMEVAPAALSDEQVWKIVHFVRTLQAHPTPREVIIDLAPKESPCIRGGVHDGESTPTDTYMWTQGPVSRFAFKLTPRPGPYHVAFRAGKVPSLPKVEMSVKLNQRDLGLVTWTNPLGYETQQLKIPPGTLRTGENQLVMKYRQVTQLSREDTRQSSLSLDWIWVAPDSP